MAGGYTVRLEQVEATHVQSCRQYVVRQRKGEDRAVLELYGEDGPIHGKAPFATITLDRDLRAYIMNDHGKTVQVIGGDRR